MIPPSLLTWIASHSLFLEYQLQRDSYGLNHIISCCLKPSNDIQVTQRESQSHNIAPYELSPIPPMTSYLPSPSPQRCTFSPPCRSSFIPGFLLQTPQPHGCSPDSHKVCSWILFDEHILLTVMFPWAPTLPPQPLSPSLLSFVSLGLVTTSRKFQKSQERSTYFCKYSIPNTLNCTAWNIYFALFTATWIHNCHL